VDICSVWLLAVLPSFWSCTLLTSSSFKLPLCLIRHNFTELQVYINILLQVCLAKQVCKISNIFSSGYWEFGLRRTERETDVD
jgi:hypothetical protein